MQEPLVLDKPVILAGKDLLHVVWLLAMAVQAGESLTGDSGSNLAQLFSVCLFYSSLLLSFEASNHEVSCTDRLVDQWSSASNASSRNPSMSCESSFSNRGHHPNCRELRAEILAAHSQARA